VPRIAPIPTLAWYRRLEARVLAGITVLVAGSLAGVLLATTRAVTTRSFDRARDDLDAARAAFYRLSDDRAEFASAQAALVTALPLFRAHMENPQLASDVATLQAMTDNYRAQLKADFCVVTDQAGEWTARAGWSGANQPAALSTIAEATAGRPARGIVPLDGRLFLVVSAPALFASEVLGTLTVGYALDDAIAERLAEVTHSEVSLLAGGQLAASSLPQDGRAALARVVTDSGLADDGVRNDVQQVGGRAYVIGAFPVSQTGSDQTHGRLVLLQDWQPTQQFLAEIRRQILLAGAIVFALSTGAGLLFSRRTSRPLQELADAAGDIAGGNWERRVPVHGSVESAMMAEAFNDMTASLRRSHEAVAERDEALRQAQKMEAVGRLAGGVAHDFNNILTAIKGYGELLIEALEPTDRRRGDAEEILKAADRAANLTRQLLAFSRRQIVAPRVVALDRIVADTEKMLRRLIGEDIDLKTTVDGTIGPVRADAGQLEQVLLNLTVNARDAMPGGGTIRIALGNIVVDEQTGDQRLPLRPGPYVRLSVADTGSGMSPETVAHIFEPFFTTKKEGQGTGLGLAMVYGIVEQAGGAIDIDTAVGRGTTFHVYLPQAAGSDAGEDGTRATPAALERGSETVLLVEDDHMVRTLVANSLRKAGYVVLEAADSTEALELARARTTPIHLLLTDVVMPGLNGRELAERLRAIHRDVRVIFMSGYSDDAILRRGVQTASADFIQKPFSMDALAARIREALLKQS
jgi:signal transduction histidine kinase/ActR/RegA family two-component response regulator